MTLDRATLQYWHSRFNYMFFENKLEPAVIILRDDADHDIEVEFDTEAEFIGGTEPFAIVFYFNPDEEQEYALTVLLHEMVHQYCYENGIEDMYYLQHTQEFVNAAENHGLTQRGYKLTEQAIDQIDKQVTILDIVSNCFGKPALNNIEQPNE